MGIKLGGGGSYISKSKNARTRDEDAEVCTFYAKVLSLVCIHISYVRNYQEKFLILGFILIKLLFSHADTKRGSSFGLKNGQPATVSNGPKKND